MCEIGISFQGRNYLVDRSVYEKGAPVVLPDNTVLKIIDWFEDSEGPVPNKIITLQGSGNGDPEEAARRLRGALAREIKD
jgi:hypothetical protein